MVNKKQKGFTLIELLIVIVIIGILSTLVIANFIGIRARARDAQRKTDLRQIQTALQLYNADQGYFPSSNSPTDPLKTCGSTVSFTNGSASNPITYMKTVPCDPKGTNVIYQYNATPTNCLPSGSACTGYTLTACIENTLDSDSDQKKGYTPPTSVNCGTGTTITVTNP